MGTLRAACLSNAVHAACAESPSAFLAIHTPTAFPKENGPKPKKRAIRVKCATKKVCHSPNACVLTHTSISQGIQGRDV